MEHDAIIVIRPGGVVQFWAQDSPEVEALLMAIEELSTCDCDGDHCPLEEMIDWRAQLRENRVEIHKD